MENPEGLVRRFYQSAINRRDLDSLDSLLAEDFKHNGECRGRSGQRSAIAAFLEGFSDLRNEILILLCDRDLVAAHQLWSGTHDGPFMGSEPDGRMVRFHSTAILRIAGGLIAEAWDVVDIELASQLDGSGCDHTMLAKRSEN